MMATVTRTPPADPPTPMRGMKRAKNQAKRLRCGGAANGLSTRAARLTSHG